MKRTVVTLALTFAAVCCFADAVSDAVELVYRRHLDIKNIYKAEEMLLAEAKAGSKLPGLFTALSMTEFYLGDMEKDKVKKLAYHENGIAYGKKAIAAEPKSDNAHFWCLSNWGRTIELKGMKNEIMAIKEIRKEIKKVLEINPEHVGALSALASFYSCAPGIVGGSIEKAEATILKAISIQPKCTFLYIDAANILIKQEKYEQAEDMLYSMLLTCEPVFEADFELMDRPNAAKLLNEIDEKKGLRDRAIGLGSRTIANAR